MIQDFVLEHLVLTDGEVVIRSAHRNDEAILTRWFSDPDVYAYWEGEVPSQEYIIDRCIVERSAEDIVWPLIIMESSQPAGYIQAWVRPDKTGGLDIFVAPQYRRKRIAVRALPMLAKYLRDDHGWKRITVDPHLWNAVAVACFQRAGFADTGERIHDAEGEHMVMEFLGG